MTGPRNPRRDFLKGSLASLGAVAALGGVQACAATASTSSSTSSTNPQERPMPFTLPALPYPENALEPSIDAQTMNIHRTKHHQAYVDNLNKALEGHADLQGKSIEQLCAGINGLPDAIKGPVRNNGGGHYNHSFFWVLMAPKGQGGAPSAALAAAIDKAFGNMDEFKAKFADAGMKRFGSGWSWLIKKTDGSLAIVSTPNQDNPLMTGLVDATGTPLLGCDVWEHAYYLKYQNRRADYLKSWWDVVNWNEVSKRFA
ncbi:MAG: superoxide dismutase [Planctomycetes bacterium]|nr:superoxide dismutase [Planctomycetota bacterium]